MADNTVYISTEESQLLLALDLHTGKEIWRYTGAAEELNGSPSLSHDTVYASSNDMYLHAVDRVRKTFLSFSRLFLDDLILNTDHFENRLLAKIGSGQTR